MYGREGRIGLIVLDSDLTIEPDLRRLLPEGVELHAARVSYPQRVTTENLRLASARAVEAVAQLLPIRPAAIAWACTSGSFNDGLAGNAALTAQLQQAAGTVPVTTASGAVRAALAALGLRRPAVGTAYSADVTERLIRFLREAGLDPAAVERLQADEGDIDDYSLQDVTTERLAAFITRLAAAPGADGVLLSCTGLATAEVAPRLERRTGRPVVTSNLAILWHCWRLGAIRPAPLCDAALMRAPLPPDPIPRAALAERTAL